MSDEEAEAFVATAELTEYDWTSLRRVKFSFSADTGVTLHDAPADGPHDPAGADTAAFPAKTNPVPATAK